jgi:hypothetical protein
LIKVPLPHEYASAVTARRAVSGFAAERRADDAVALLVASELVTNAVMHGAAPVTLAAAGESPATRTARRCGRSWRLVPLPESAGSHGRP